MSVTVRATRKLALLAVVLVVLSLLVVSWAGQPDAAWAYPYCSCTGYASSMRPDLPQNLGNAKDWARNAATQGFSVDGTPRVGDIAVFPPGVQGADSINGHVAYVEAVYGSTSFHVSEWSFPTPCVVTDRTADSSGGVLFIHKKGFGRSDFDGDGKDDVGGIYDYGGKIGIWAFKSTGKGFTASKWYTSGSWSFSRSAFVAGDFDGDGKGDVGGIYDYGGKIGIWAFKSTGKGFTASKWYTSGGWTFSRSLFL